MGSAIPRTGARGSASYQSFEIPRNYDEFLRFVVRRGMSRTGILQALIGKSGRRKTSAAKFEWGQKRLGDQRGDVTAVYTTPSLAAGDLYSGGDAAAGTILYVKVAEAVAKEFREGHQVQIRRKDLRNVHVNGKVIANGVVPNGASSYIAVKTLIADTQSDSGDLTSGDREIMVVGNVNAEFAGRPPIVGYDPASFYNYTTIFRTPLGLSRTALMSEFRWAEANKLPQEQKEKLYFHNLEIEKALLYSVRSLSQAENGFPERTSAGVEQWLDLYLEENEDAPNRQDYVVDTGSDYSGKTWLAGGNKWFPYKLEEITRLTNADRFSAICGSGALLGLNDLARTYANLQLTPDSKEWGLDIFKLRTPFANLELVEYPLFTLNEAYRNSIFFVPGAFSENIEIRYLMDVTYCPDADTMPKKTKEAITPRSGAAVLDGRLDEWMSELGFQFHNVEGWGFLHGVGQDNTVGS